MATKKSIRERFEEKFERVTESGCWLWTAALINSGYGVIGTGFPGEIALAHRVSWRLYHGEIPDGMFVLHRCDVRCCVNPNHLFIGDQFSNARDMVNKGRGVTPNTRGENNPSAILMESDVPVIRALRASGRTLQSIADVYGVTLHCIKRLIDGKTWKHVI